MDLTLSPLPPLAKLIHCSDKLVQGGPAVVTELAGRKYHMTQPFHSHVDPKELKQVLTDTYTHIHSSTKGRNDPHVHQ